MQTSAEIVGKYTAGPGLSFAGNGIFGPDEFRDRVATFSSNADAKLYGPVFAAAPDLLEALKLALECISYCRRAHTDAQGGNGVPVEALLQSAIFKAENGREPTSVEFCNFALGAITHVAKSEGAQ